MALLISFVFLVESDSRLNSGSISFVRSFARPGVLVAFNELFSVLAGAFELVVLVVVNFGLLKFGPKFTLQDRKIPRTKLFEFAVR